MLHKLLITMFDTDIVHLAMGIYVISPYYIGAKFSNGLPAELHNIRNKQNCSINIKDYLRQT